MTATSRWNVNPSDCLFLSLSFSLLLVANWDYGSSVAKIMNSDAGIVGIGIVGVGYTLSICYSFLSNTQTNSSAVMHLSFFFLFFSFLSLELS